MGSGDKSKSIGMVEMSCYILPKSISSSTRRYSPTTTIIRVRPQQIAHGPFVRNLYIQSREKQINQRKHKFVIQPQKYFIFQSLTPKIYYTYASLFDLKSTVPSIWIACTRKKNCRHMKNSRSLCKTPTAPPTQKLKQPFPSYLLYTIQSSDVVQCVQRWWKASMQTENL